jgi:hypothetical protein
LNLSGQPLLLERFRGGGFVAMVSNLVSYDPVLLGLAIVGCVALFLRLRRGSWKRIDAERVSSRRTSS